MADTCVVRKENPSRSRGSKEKTLVVEERSVFERSKHIAARVDGSTSDSTCSREIVKEIRLTNPLQYLPEEYNEIYMYVCINPPLDPRGAKPSSLHK